MLWAILAVLAMTIGVLAYNHQGGSIGGLANDDIASLVFFSVLGVTIGSGVVMSYSGRFGKAARDLSAWVAVATLLVAGYAYRDQLVPVVNRMAAVLVPGMAVDSGTPGELIVERSGDGHFNIRARVNGQSVPMVVDTGASAVVLTDQAARAVGLDPLRLDYSVTVSTANGITTVAPVVLATLDIGSIRFERIEAAVARPGALSDNLLGMNALNLLSGYEVRGDRLILRR
jgi:aspartyl protease family protein